MDARTATLAGYTHAEVKANFADYLAALGEANGLTPEGAFGRVVQMYDGYRFEENAPRVVNPVSFGRCLCERKFKGYWYETGTPTFLVNMLKARPVDISEVEVSESDLGTYEPSNPSLVPLLFQAGYLTIADFYQRGTTRRYALDFPNLEVENSFLRQVVPAYTGQERNRANDIQADAVDALYDHEPEKFVAALRRLFANIPYDLTDRQNGQMWQTIVYVVLKAFGAGVSAEVKTNEGRIDMTAETPGHCYVIEFKLDTSAAEAIRQIKEKHYADTFAGNGKTLTLIGFAFSKEKRTIVDAAVEEA